MEVVVPHDGKNVSYMRQFLGLDCLCQLAQIMLILKTGENWPNLLLILLRVRLVPYKVGFTPYKIMFRIMILF